VISVYISDGAVPFYSIEYKLSFKLEKSTAVKQTTTKNKYKIALYIVSTPLLFYSRFLLTVNYFTTFNYKKQYEITIIFVFKYEFFVTKNRGMTNTALTWEI
jgi:hypothetical protein